MLVLVITRGVHVQRLMIWAGAAFAVVCGSVAVAPIAMVGVVVCVVAVYVFMGNTAPPDRS